MFGGRLSFPGERKAIKEAKINSIMNHIKWQNEGLINGERK
jgi:hypothetical protein